MRIEDGKSKLSKKRIAENELFFRQPNKKVYEGFRELREVAKELNHKELLKEADPPINFYCECSDENCKKRIRIKPSQYGALHKNDSQFLILPGHSVPVIERTIKSAKNYKVVEKFIKPKGKINKPHKTNVDNV